MPAIANVVLQDGEATPVSHTFEPAKTTADFALWEDRDAGIYIGNKKLSLTLTRPQGTSNVGNRNLKVHLKLEMPRLEVVSNSTVTGIAPAPTVAYRPVAEAIFTLPERSTKQERKNLMVIFRKAFDAGAITGAIEDLSVPY